LKDSNRLLALAAFVFSVTTGVYATYQTWKSSTQTTVDTVSKLADQYYDGQGKLSQLNSTQAGYSNFLRTTLRSTALRASALATAANSYIDEGTWLALAQMNDNENNLRASQAAWNEAANKTQDITTYLFATRGLGANLLRQGDGNGAVKAFNRATDTAMSDKFKGAENSLPPAYRNVEAASTQAFWLSLIQTTDCAFISDHFDKALKYIADSHRTANSADPTYENELLTTRQFISYFRKARESCAHQKMIS
jgi:hypothetical protein